MKEEIFDYFDEYTEMADSETFVTLEDDCREQARNWSKRINNESREWPVYLQMLALKGFQHWIKQRQPDLAIDVSQTSVLNQAYANVMDAVCHCKVGDFDVCLLPIWGIQPADEILLPRAVVDLPEFAAHFYVIIGIDESQEQAAIQGFLNYDQIVAACDSIEPDMDWNYPLLAEDFEADVSNLPLNLSCLNAGSILLPVIPKNRQAVLRKFQPILEDLLPQIQKQPLWKVLTWEQATVVLTNADLLKWLWYRPSIAEEVLKTACLDLWQLVCRPAMNVYRWTQGQLDTITSESNWSLALATATRSSGTDLDTRFGNQCSDQTLVSLLKEISTDIPLEESVNSSVYQDIGFKFKPVRVYAAVWNSPAMENTWNLLLIAGALPGDNPPEGLRLRISDVTGVLMDDVLVTEAGESYIYGQVQGSFDEKFLVTLTDVNGEVKSLHPFEYQAEVSL